MEGVTNEMILNRMDNDQKQVMDKESLLKWIEKKYVPELNDEFGDVLITAGAGDIDALVEPIRKIIEQNS
jgi:UDP-N-acetylmuramate--alanine ligase